MQCQSETYKTFDLKKNSVVIINLGDILLLHKRKEHAINDRIEPHSIYV